jgi:hypothetical protein
VVSGIEGSAVTGRIDLSEDRGVNNLGSDIRRLAALGPFDYERVRGETAQRLGVRTTVLDKWVAAEREPAARCKAGRSNCPNPSHIPSR